MMQGAQVYGGQMPVPNPFGISLQVGPELRARLEFQQQRPGHQYFINTGVPIHNMSPERGTPERIPQQGSPGSMMFQSPSMQNFGNSKNVESTKSSTHGLRAGARRTSDACVCGTLKPNIWRLFYFCNERVGFPPQSLDDWRA